MTDTIPETSALPQHVELVDFTVLTGLRIHSRVSIVLLVDGKRCVEEEDEKGNGPIDTFAEAFKLIVPHNLVGDCRFDVVGRGTTASCFTRVTLTDGDRTFFARCGDPNPMIATAKAYVDAFNMYLQELNGDMAEDKIAAMC